MPPGLCVLFSLAALWPALRLLMRTRIIALLLLLTLGFTLGLGAHPCAAMEGGPTETASAAAPASCHAHAAPAADSSPTEEAGAPADADHPCPHFCHTAGLVAVAAPILVVQAVAQIASVPAERASSAPARSIDHVPLP